jgi:hypothetical protein
MSEYRTVTKSVYGHATEAARDAAASIGRRLTRIRKRRQRTAEELVPGPLVEIPYVDLRQRSLVDLLRERHESARALVSAAANMFGAASRVASRFALPLGDRVSLAWLKRNNNAYLPEIDACADFLGIDGVYALNTCFEWGCTAGAFRLDDGIALRRVLDWAFPALGEHIVVAHQAGPAGEFYNVTWPGMSGVFQANAPGRFAAAINQAPMRKHGHSLVMNWARNRVMTRDEAGMPPAHLLRKVFEEAPDYASALKMLCETRVAIPVIYVLTGIADNEGAVIERIEDDFAVRAISDDLSGDRVCATNQFESRLNLEGAGWMPRSGGSAERLQCAQSIGVDALRHDFDWFVPPIANEKSRVVMNANARTGALSVIGTEGNVAATRPFELAAAG